ncbi:MAG: hypothetical protein P4L67_00415 [Candidatus Pacebacteria bacterium]|nr:hypothetical protein [Candidatus Paceibacterota bacterium]
MKNNGSVTILRWGLAFVFFYAAIASVTRPERWVIYVPSFVSSVVAPQSFLVAFSLYELVLAGFLFSGRKLFWSSLFAVITLAAVVVVDFSLMALVFTDIGLAFAALALFDFARNNRTVNAPNGENLSA